MKKRILSLLLAVMMVVGMMTVTASAAEVPGNKFLSASAASTGIGKYTDTKFNWTYDVVLFPVGTEISLNDSSCVMSASTMGDYKFVSSKSFTVEAGKTYMVTASNPMNMEDYVVYIGAGSGTAAPAPVEPAPAPAEPAVSVEQPSGWAVELVNQAIEAGIVPAELQCKYGEAITRAEFCALATAAYESVKGEVTERVEFTDTDNVNVEKMAALGVVGGAGDGKFLPDNSLTREQAAVILAQLSKQLDNELDEVESAFADNADISGWALKAAGQVQNAGIMSGGDGGKFLPKLTYTREQSIITVLRVVEAAK